ncbi:MAG: hypothetical protein RJA81_860 [Planctomycetota bacterium]
MIRSIRHQIEVPLIAIQLLIALITAATATTLTAHQVNSQIRARFQGVSSVLSNASFPLTPAILNRLHDLTEAHFLVIDHHGNVLRTSLHSSLLEMLPTGDTLLSLMDNQRLQWPGCDFLCYRISTVSPNQSIIALYPRSRRQAAFQQAILPPLIQGLGGLLLMIFATRWIAGRMSGRLREMQWQVARIGNGHFDPSIELLVPEENVLKKDGQQDEIQLLAHSISQMQLELNRMHNAIKTNERMNILAQIASGLAHQLRNSIAAARMGVQLHLKRCPVQPESDRSLQVVLTQLQLTQEQLQGVLNWNSQGGETDLREINLKLLVEQVIQLIQYQADHRQVEIRPFFCDCEVTLTANESEIRTSLLSLVQNAIEAASQNGLVEIQLTADEHHDDVILKILDSGNETGHLNRTDLGSAFSSNKPEGLGLGLYLACQVAERHGGEIIWFRQNEMTVFQWVFHKSKKSAVNHSLESVEIVPDSDY